MIGLDEPKHLTNMTQNDPFSLDYTLFKGQGLDHVKVKSMLPSIVKG